MVLCDSSQALDPTFLGTSGDCRYSDLTGELPTANGYTNGGEVLTSVSLSITGPVVEFTCANPSWTLSGPGITFKYLVIKDNTAANGDLVFMCDMDTSGGSVSFAPGALTIQINAAGIATLQ